MSTASTSGLHLKTPHRMLRDAVELMSSMRFAITLLTVIAIASVVGTVLKQNEPYPNYVNQFGPFWADVFHALSLQKVYGSWWFLLILAFLVVSTSLCIARNAPKMIVDMRSWKDHVRERSLRAFHHRGEFEAARPRAEAVSRVTALLRNRGYRTRQVEHEGATLLAAKSGAANKLGYILAHTAIVVICIGGLLDGDMLIRAQMWFGGKSPISGNAVISEIPPQHRLSASNPGFRGNAFVPEGSTVSTAILNIADGAIVQDLPFNLTLKKFTIDFYPTGMPKLFASDVVVTDRATGKQTHATVKVNEPLIVDGVAIYQSSFEDGGSQLKSSAIRCRAALMAPSRRRHRRRQCTADCHGYGRRRGRTDRRVQRLPADEYRKRHRRLRQARRARRGAQVVQRDHRVPPGGRRQCAEGKDAAQRRPVGAVQAARPQRSGARVQQLHGAGAA